MATIRKHRSKWQVQVRRRGKAPLSRSFVKHRDAVQWARQTEGQFERELPSRGTTPLSSVSLKDLVERYRDFISIHKRGHEVEKIVLDAQRP